MKKLPQMPRTTELSLDGWAAVALATVLVVYGVAMAALLTYPLWSK